MTLPIMTTYADDLPTEIMYPVQEITMTLAETISQAGLTQVHSAETEGTEIKN